MSAPHDPVKRAYDTDDQVIDLRERTRHRREGAGQAQPIHPPRGRADKSVNRTLETKARALAGWKAYTTNLATCPDGTPVTPEFVIEAYHRLYAIEASFRMSKHDLAARPIYHHQRESIQAHLSIVFAALAVGR